MSYQGMRSSGAFSESRKDQERERQHQRDQQVEIFGVELGVADEEAQRELLVDAQQDRRGGRDDQRPAPAAAQRAHARDLGFLQMADAGVRIVELDALGGRDGAIGHGR